jgi:hypothetical protein
MARSPCTAHTVWRTKLRLSGNGGKEASKVAGGTGTPGGGARSWTKPGRCGIFFSVELSRKFKP